MTYDAEKYRSKREKVLGVRRRGVSFGTLTVIVSVVILMGFGALVIPKSVAWWNGRHLEDAIYRLRGGEPWPGSIVSELGLVPGVRGVITDKDGTRLVITFDRTAADPSRFSPVFEKNRLNADLLNTKAHMNDMNGQEG
ncbi:MAG: hypothetical protein Q7J01_01305 [Syntrophales bacterium]|nr:hypothetical protein [Syntrophales bacterium]